MTESSHYRLHSRLTRVTTKLLLEILNLRKSLTGISQFSSIVHLDIIEDWNIMKSPLLIGCSITSLSSSSSTSNTHDIEKAQPSLVVTQISSNSITVSWSGLPDGDDWGTTTKSSSSSLSQNRIAASVGGLLASIKGSSIPQSIHTSYSLYITPMSGAQQTLPLEHRSRSLLVLPYVCPSGTQKIDLLDPGNIFLSIYCLFLVYFLFISLIKLLLDTLYKISLLSDDERKSTNSDERISEEKKSPFGWSLRSGDRSKSITEALGFTYSLGDSKKSVTDNSNNSNNHNNNGNNHNSISNNNKIDNSIGNKEKERDSLTSNPYEEISIMASTCGNYYFSLKF